MSHPINGISRDVFEAVRSHAPDAHPQVAAVVWMDNNRADICDWIVHGLADRTANHLLAAGLRRMADHLDPQHLVPS